MLAFVHSSQVNRLKNELLNAEGFDITRRTVAKYRDLEGIPTARLRGR